MATWTERLELLIDANTRGAVSGIKDVDRALDDVGHPTAGRFAQMKASAGSALSSVAGPLGAIGSAAGATGKALTGAAVAAGAFAAVKLAEGAKEAADEWVGLAAQVRDFQRASGASADEASRWVAVLDDMGLAADTGGKAAFKLGKEIDSGGEKLKAFGIEVATNEDGSRNLTETLLNVADAYTETEDPATKAALAQAAFGKAGLNLIPILEQGRKGLKSFFDEAEGGHQIFTQEDLARAREYELAVDNLGDTLRGFTLQVGAVAAPTITKFANGLSDTLTAADDATASLGGLGTVIGKTVGFAAAFNPINNGINGIATTSNLAKGEWGDAAESFVKTLPVVGGVISGVSSLFGDGADAAESYTTQQNTLGEATKKVADLAAQGKQGTDEYRTAIAEADTAADTYEKTQRRVADALGTTAERQFAANQAALGAAAAGVDVHQAWIGVDDAMRKAAEAAFFASLGGDNAAESARNLRVAELAAQESVLAYIAAAQKKAIADAGPNADAAEQAAAASAAQDQAIIDMTNSVPGAVTALDGLGYTVRTLPDGKQIVITTNAAEIEANLRRLKNLINTREAGGWEINVPFSTTRSAPPANGNAAPAGLAAPPAGVLARGVPASPVPLAGGMPTATPRAAAGAMVVNVNITAGGLGADAPEIQRAVVAALRGYVNRNGPLPELREYVTVWVPGDPWPGTKGGAHGGPSYPWGTPIRLYVRAGLAAGRAWHIGPHAAARLDAGNVIGPVAADADPPTIDGRLWVDLSCDTSGLVVNDGSTTAAGIFSRDEAATLTLDLFDPFRKYDPLNANGPYWYQGTTRLTAGVPVEVFAEVVNPTTSAITRYTLFKGTADRWTHDLDPIAAERRTRVVATGGVKALANTNYEETASVGAGDTTAQRIARLVAYYGFTGGVERVGAESTVTLAATTLAQSAWELFNRTVDDELGYVHVTPDGVLRWLTRNAWYVSGPPAITLGCSPVAPAAYDIVTDLRMGSVDEQLRNAVYASRSGGIMQTVKSQPSIAKHGGYETTLRRTDLGLANDTQVAEWAGTVIMLYAYPLSAPDALSLLPARVVDPTGAIWRAVLGANVASDFVRVVWDPHDTTAPLDTTVRVVGRRHEISATGWSVDWAVVPAGLATANVWHMGPHALDRLDDGNVVGFRKTA